MFVIVPTIPNSLLFVVFVLFPFPLPDFARYPLFLPWPSLSQIRFHVVVNLLTDPGLQTPHEEREGFLLGHLQNFLHQSTKFLNVHTNTATHLNFH